MSNLADLTRVNPGEMIHKITVYQPVTGMGIAGARVTYKPFCQLQAKIEDIHGDDRIKSGQDSQKLAIRITVYRYPGVNSAMRVILDTGEMCEIMTTKDPDRTGRYMVMLCIETGLDVLPSSDFPGVVP